MAGSSTPSYGRWPRAGCRPRVGRPGAAAVTGLLAAILLSGYPLAGAAQTVQGQLVDAGTGAPVEGALVLLLSEAGEEAAGYLTNPAGRFILRAPTPGTYTLRAERIGYATTTSGPFSLAQGQQLTLHLETAETAIELEGIRVEGSQQCVVRPGEGLQLAAVWDEARKALTVQDWTEREGAYRFQVTRYERELDVAGRTVQSESRQVLSNVTGVPIRSLPAEDLMTQGFVRPSGGGGYDYFGPDASVLLSDQFLDTHCLRLTLSQGRPGEVGLAFEPVRAGGIPDIMGTLWLEAGTLRLRVLEYVYTWTPWEAVQGIARGRVEFENLPSGAWVIDNWWIQMPLVATDMTMAIMQRTSGIRLVGIKEVGGGITRFTSSERGEPSEAPKGVLEGQVWDSTRQAPLAGATVFLSGTQYAAETDEGGNFQILDLPGGVFSAAFTHPRLDSLGVFSAGREVEIIPGEIATLVLAIPSSAAIMASACAQEELREGTGVVTGLVRDAETEAPVGGATVTVFWSTFERRGVSFVENRQGLRATTDATGRYAACGVPFDASLTLQATYLDRKTEAVQVQSEREGYTVVHLVLPG
jgi:hypothetical protein